MIINMGIKELPQQTGTASRSYYYASKEGTLTCSGPSCTMTITPPSAYSKTLGVVGYYTVSSGQRVFGANYNQIPWLQSGKDAIIKNSVGDYVFGTDRVTTNVAPNTATQVRYMIFYKY